MLNWRLLNHFLAIFLVLFIATSCKQESTDSSSAEGKGGISVQATWPNDSTQPANSSSVAQATLDDQIAFSSPAIPGPSMASVMPSSLQTMRFIVTGSDMATVQKDFVASAGSGTVSGIPAGTNRTLTLQGFDSTGAKLYEGTQTGITVVAGQTSSAGAINMLSTTYRLPDTGQTNDHTATFGEDNDYWDNPMSFTDNGNSTITDNNTGLIWQKEGDGTKRDWSDAGTYCGSLTFGDYTDWRLPTPKELASILHYGNDRPAIDTTYFLDTTSDTYWTSTTSTRDTLRAFNLSFTEGGDGTHLKTTADDYVRCVRGYSPADSFTNNSDGTITDNLTNLMWQREDDNIARDWEDSISYCENSNLAGKSDWRLPNIRELKTIVDYSSFDPAINSTYFPNTNYLDATAYWSSTTHNVNNTVAWLAYFNNGTVNGDFKIENYYTRCVRNKGYDWSTLPASQNWSKDSDHNPIIDIGSSGSFDDYHVQAEAALYDNHNYYLWYQGHNQGTWEGIGLAKSTNGLDWEKQNNGNLVFEKGDAGKFDDASVTYPDVLKIGNTFHMWYTGSDGTNSRIGYATSTDGISWIRQNLENAVLDLGTGGKFDDYGVYHPSVLFDGATFHMWYTGNDQGVTRIGYATSADGINWNRQNNDNAVLDLGINGSFDDVHVTYPNVKYQGGIFHMWYLGYDGAKYTMGYASSTDGISWDKSAARPIESSTSGFDSGDDIYPGPVLEVNSGELEMFYSGTDGINWRIGRAFLQ